MYDRNSSQKPKKPYQAVVNRSVISLMVQVALYTLIIIFGAVFLGLWLDKTFNTAPIIVLVLIIVSIPVSILVILSVVRATVKKMKDEQNNSSGNSEEE
jgi:F0F1-type ATP synthase assembly protein I